MPVGSKSLAKAKKITHNIYSVINIIFKKQCIMFE